jgi:hypothetical protein
MAASFIAEATVPDFSSPVLHALIRCDSLKPFHSKACLYFGKMSVK